MKLNHYWDIISQNYYLILITYFIICILFISFSNKTISEWIKNKQKKILIIFVFILPILIIIGLFTYVSKESFDGGDPLVEINRDQIKSGEINSGYMGFEFLEGCNYDEYINKYKDTEYKILSVFGESKKSPINFSDYKSYTNVFDISGNIEEAYLCIKSNVVPYRQNHRFYYTTYILFNEPEFAGHINVAYSKENKVMYDRTSGSSNQELDGRFWGDETPKIYQENLSGLIVADVKNGGYEIIPVINRLKKPGYIRIGGFVNATNQEGILEEFLIIYKGGIIEAK